MSAQELSVTLVGPEYPINVGYMARLMKNFGIGKLYLIDPNFDSNVASVYASHGAEVLERAERTDFRELRRRHEVLVATTAIKATRGSNLVRRTSTPEEVVRYLAGVKSVSLVFGRDTTGLKNEELALCDVVTTIDTGTRYRTLNVSHAAAVMLYLFSISRREVQRDKGQEQSARVREVFSRYSRELAVASGLQPHKAERLGNVLNRIALKSDLDDKDLALMISLIRKAISAIDRSRPEDQTRSKT